MELTSPAFRHREAIPKEHTCEGKDTSPALAWSNPPVGTGSFALIMDDPDAPSGTWIHWIAYDIPATAHGLAAGLPKNPALADGTKQGACWGVNSFSRVGYHGPCPPPGKPHRYSFRLYALDRPPDLPSKATKMQVETAMNGHVLASAELVGTYGR